jgi:hypothetical protein
MPTYEDFNAIVDGMKAVLTTNITSLGGTAGTTQILEGDELPAAIRTFPTIYIIPLGGGPDQITTKQSNSPRFHEFSVIIAGAYKSATIPSMLRTVRNYGFAAADIFSLSGQAVSGVYYDQDGKVDTTKAIKAYCINPKVSTGYHQVKDYFVVTWTLELSVKMVTN